MGEGRAKRRKEGNPDSFNVKEILRRRLVERQEEIESGVNRECLG